MENGTLVGTVAVSTVMPVVDIVDTGLETWVDGRDVVETVEATPEVMEDVLMEPGVERGMVVMGFPVVIPGVVETRVVLWVVVTTMGGGVEAVEDAGVVLLPAVLPGVSVVVGCTMVTPGVVETRVELWVVVNTMGGGVEPVEDAGVVLLPAVLPGFSVVEAAGVLSGVVLGWQGLYSQHWYLTWKL